MKLYLPEATYISSTACPISDSVSQKRLLIQKISTNDDEITSEQYVNEANASLEITVALTDRTHLNYQMPPMGEPQS
jgi:hypothetical protein